MPTIFEQLTEIDLKKHSPATEPDEKLRVARSKGVTLHSSRQGWTVRAAGTLMEIEKFTELENAENWATHNRCKIHGVYPR